MIQLMITCRNCGSEFRSRTRLDELSFSSAILREQIWIMPCL